jgi:Co/Zn/Cd efflux system component
MSDECCAPAGPATDRRYVRILWIALAANAVMFLIELAASAYSGSSALAAAAGVLGTGTVWPDIAVAAVLATLGLASGRAVVAHALAELRGAAPAPATRTLQGPGSATRARS